MTWTFDPFRVFYTSSCNFCVYWVRSVNHNQRRSDGQIYGWTVVVVPSLPFDTEPVVNLKFSLKQVEVQTTIEKPSWQTVIMILSFVYLFIYSFRKKEGVDPYDTSERVIVRRPYFLRYGPYTSSTGMLKSNPEEKGGWRTQRCGCRDTIHTVTRDLIVTTAEGNGESKSEDLSVDGAYLPLGTLRGFTSVCGLSVYTGGLDSCSVGWPERGYVIICVYWK